jgi:hypothetical protein
VVAVELSTRAKHDFLSVWNADNASSPQRFQRIGSKLQEVLHLHSAAKPLYKRFSQSLVDNSSFRHARQYGYKSNNNNHHHNSNSHHNNNHHHNSHHNSNNHHNNHHHNNQRFSRNSNSSGGGFQ